ncbi:MAG: DUF4175 family protein [Pseudomonadota bacterium]|nr:DUF4175 family protein [Pseudomonadota bacterium]
MFKIRYLQLLLFITKNLKYIFILSLIIFLFFISSILGFWHLFAGIFHIIVLILLLLVSFFLLFKYKRKIKYVSFNSAQLWLEKKNFENTNPLSAIKDVPAGENFNHVMWEAHIAQTKKDIKNIIFYYPKLSLERVDPLKIRLIFLLFFAVSLFWGYSNKVIEKNLVKVLQIDFSTEESSKEKFNIVAWVKPPLYTGLPQKNIGMENFSGSRKKEFFVPFSSEIFIKTYGSIPSAMKISVDNNDEYTFKKGSDIDFIHQLKKDQNIIFLKEKKEIFNTNFRVIEDLKPKVNFISNPETVNGVSIKFLIQANDDYGIVEAKVEFLKPEEFDHFKEDLLTYDLQVFKEKKNKLLKSLFFKNMSSHIWAGSLSNVKVRVYDDLNQEAAVLKSIKIPEKEFFSPVAKKIYTIRSKLAKNHISLNKATTVINNLFLQSKEIYLDKLINDKYENALAILEELDQIPLSYESTLYSSLWELALVLEEGKAFSVKKNLEQIEQNLFDSINQRDTEKVSTNLEKFKESIQSLLDLKNEEQKKSLVNNEGSDNYKKQIQKTTNNLKDLLKTGTKENLENKIQELQQLAESIKNPKLPNDNEILKEQQKRDFINKLSELLNKQEIIMEESFNKAANRGKFKQSSEGSGGRTSQEKQDNLRNTLGNIMRDIGESENEIPQELGRADRAMRQATRELKNGRPDQASNAQGRASEMIRRAMKRIRNDSFDEAKSANSNEKNIEGDSVLNFSENKNDLEYQGTSLGGKLEIPQSIEVHKAKKIAQELYKRYNQEDRSDNEKKYIKSLLDWF